MNSDFRQAIISYIREQAQPPDKFSHQPRLYQLAVALAEGKPFDDDVVFASVWLHDLGVFVGHRPNDPARLAAWDHIAYALQRLPLLLQEFNFPDAKIAPVLEVIRTHMPHSRPTTFEGILVHDADILEQLGAMGILRTVSKVGRDTRFIRFSDALQLLRKNLDTLPAKLNLDSARRLAVPKLESLRAFLDAADAEAKAVELQ